MHEWNGMITNPVMAGELDWGRGCISASLMVLNTEFFNSSNYSLHYICQPFILHPTFQGYYTCEIKVSKLWQVKAYGGWQCQILSAIFLQLTIGSCFSMHYQNMVLVV